jgi:ubiquinone biosynthesis protein
MTGSLPEKYREFLADIILGFVSRDSSRIAKTLKKFSRTDEAYDMNNLELQISELVDEFTFIPLNKIDSTQVLNKIKALLVQYKLNLPPAVFLLAKSLIIIEGVARKLDPDFNISEYVQPFAKRLMSEKVDPIGLVKKNYPKAIDLVHNLLEFPGIAFDISEMLRDGKIKIGLDHKGLSPMLENNRKNSQIIALSVITASVFLTSGIIIAAKIPPFWNNLSVAGLIGIAFSLLLLLITFIKGRR